MKIVEYDNGEFIVLEVEVYKELSFTKVISA